MHHLATQAIFLEEIEHSTKRSRKASSVTPMRWNMQVLLPVIITSAHLVTCDFNPKDVDPNTGEIPFENAQLTEHPYLNRNLQHSYSYAAFKFRAASSSAIA